MKRPATVKIAIGLELLKLGLLFAIITTYYFIKDGDNSASPVVRGMKAGFDNSFGLTDPSSAYNFGTLLGYLFIPILLSIIAVLLIHHRKWIAAIVVVSLEIAAGFGGGSLPILPVVVMILICTNPGQKYLKNKPEPPVPPISGQEPNV